MNKILFLALLLAFSYSCQQTQKKKPTQEEMIEYKRRLAQIHRQIISNDVDSIRNIIKQNSWDMIETKTGLWYSIDSSTQGNYPNEGDLVTVNYSVELLDSTICYSKEHIGFKKFIVGHGNIETGIQEGVLRMKEGEKARLILPPHLAFGVVGDGNKIPRLSILLYRIELLHIQKKPKPVEPVFK